MSITSAGQLHDCQRSINHAYDPSLEGLESLLDTPVREDETHVFSRVFSRSFRFIRILQSDKLGLHGSNQTCVFALLQNSISIISKLAVRVRAG